MEISHFSYLVLLNDNKDSIHLLIKIQTLEMSHIFLRIELDKEVTC